MPDNDVGVLGHDVDVGVRLPLPAGLATTLGCLLPTGDLRIGFFSVFRRRDAMSVRYRVDIGLDFMLAKNGVRCIGDMWSPSSSSSPSSSFSSSSSSSASLRSPSRLLSSGTSPSCSDTLLSFLLRVSRSAFRSVAIARTACSRNDDVDENSLMVSGLIFASTSSDVSGRGDSSLLGPRDDLALLDEGLSNAMTGARPRPSMIAVSAARPLVGRRSINNQQSSSKLSSKRKMQKNNSKIKERFEGEGESWLRAESKK